MGGGLLFKTIRKNVFAAHSCKTSERGVALRVLAVADMQRAVFLDLAEAILTV